MPVQQAGFNFTQGIEGVAQSPPRPGGLGALPASTQILPGATTTEPVTADALWLEAASRWDADMRQFLTPRNIAPDVLLPSVLQARLRRVRQKADKAARQKQSAQLRALTDVLDDDEQLNDLLQSYRTALMKA